MMGRGLLVGFVFATALVSFCGGCGMVTHSLIAHRALSLLYSPTATFQPFADLVRKYPNSVIAGAPFPDYLYECGPDHSHGEDAHWPPFQAAAASYIRETFPNLLTSPTEESSRLLAFMFGVVSHSIADINWHGLGSLQGYGLIETIGAFDFNGTGALDPLPHTMADTGGEFLAARQTDLSWFEPLQWVVPVSHLVKIFARLNDTVNPVDIDKCLGIFMAGSEAVKHLATTVAQYETNPSPYFQDNYIDMPLGGVDDMAVWTTQMWDRFASWVLSGIPSPLPPFYESDSSRPSKPQRSPAVRLAKLLGPIYLEAQNQHGNSRCALFTHIAARFEQPQPSADDFELFELLQSVGITHNHLSTAAAGCRPPAPSKQDKATAVSDPSVLTPIATLSGSRQWGYFGQSVAVGDLDHDGKMDLAAGIPGAVTPRPDGGVYAQGGGVSVVFGVAAQTEDVDSGSVNSTEWLFKEWFGRFGSSMAIADVNCDGVDDLVVSAPVSGWNWMQVQPIANYTYHGQVSIFFGPLESSTVQQWQPNVVISAQGQDLAFFGQVLIAADIDNDGCKDVLVGSPMAQAPGTTGRAGAQQGQIHAFLSSTLSKPQLTLSDASLHILGSAPYAHFGASIAVSGAARLLVVGSPGFKCSDCPTKGSSATGKISAYSIAQDQSDPAKFVASVAFEIEASTPKGRFGHALDLTAAGNMLAVSAPSNPFGSTDIANKTFGTVWVLNITGYSGVLSIDSLETVGTLECRTDEFRDSRFGHQVQFYTSPSTITTSNNRKRKTPNAPLSPQTEEDPIADRFSPPLVVTAPAYSPALEVDRGAVWVYQGLADNQHVMDCEFMAQAKFVGTNNRARLGSSLVVHGSVAVVGSPRESSANAEMSGAVYVFQLP